MYKIIGLVTIMRLIRNFLAQTVTEFQIMLLGIITYLCSVSFFNCVAWKLLACILLKQLFVFCCGAVVFLNNSLQHIRFSIFAFLRLQVF